MFTYLERTEYYLNKSYPYAGVLGVWNVSNFIPYSNSIINIIDWFI